MVIYSARQRSEMWNCGKMGLGEAFRGQPVLATQPEGLAAVASQGEGLVEFCLESCVP